MQQPSLLSARDAEFQACLEAEVLNLIQDRSSSLKPQYQSIDWTTAIAAEKLSQAIAPQLRNLGDYAAALGWVQTAILPKLFRAEFLDPNHPNSITNDFLARLDARTTHPSFTAADTAADTAAKNDPHSAIANQLETTAVPEPSGIAVLLLDAENLQLKAEEESFLQKNCPYPIQVKLAFANWRKLGQLDQTLHSRSYDLIHVPSGKDHADGKMIAMGTSIHEQYPQTRAVLICSSDGIMTSLHSQLAKNKIQAYQVVRASQGLTLLSGFNGDRQEVVMPKPLDLSLGEAIVHLEKIVAAECQRTQMPVAKLAPVSAGFATQHKLGLKDIALHYKLGEKALHVLEAYPDKFKLHRLGQPPGWFIELRQEQSSASPPNSSSSGGNQNSSSTGEISKSSQSTLPLKSAKMLRTALLQCVQQQTSAEHSEVDVGAIAARFRQLHEESTSAALKRLQLGQKLVPFLSQQPELAMRKDKNRWWVSLKQNQKRN